MAGRTQENLQSQKYSRIRIKHIYYMNKRPSEDFSEGLSFYIADYEDYTDCTEKNDGIRLRKNAGSSDFKKTEILYNSICYIKLHFK